jgi:hypothetical protein
MDDSERFASRFPSGMTERKARADFFAEAKFQVFPFFFHFRFSPIAVLLRVCGKRGNSLQNPA